MQVSIRHRAGGIVNAAALAVLIAILALVALVTKPPPPPNVAEFAPQAVEQIVDAPSNQSSRFGSGAGEGASGTADQRSSAGQGPVDVARVRRCVGSPPRQIEDPQSPPCVPYFQGNNGGATYKGVTRDEIRVAIPSSSYADGDSRISRPEQDQLSFSLFEEFFNSRFELYGRKLKLVETPTKGCEERSPATQVARAVAVDEELRAFASLDWENYCNASDVGIFYDELAKRRLISVEYATTFRSEDKDLGHHRPYQWNFLPTSDAILQDLAEWTCKGLARRPAAFGGPQVQLRDRKFAILTSASETERADLGPLTTNLERCGVTPALVFNPAQDTESALAQMKSDGVTSILCVCDKTMGNYMGDAADANEPDYQPEWIMGGISGPDGDHWPASYALFPNHQSQRAHLFGLTGANKVNRLDSEPWWWAVREVRPETRESDLIANIQGLGHWDMNKRYKQLLLLASGIQMAGPKITPQAFEAALMRTSFSNPGCGAHPFYQGCVGFNPSDHAMVSGASVTWWDEAGESYVATNRGTHCYLEMGTRWSSGRWPGGQPALFDRTQPCK